MDENKKKKLQEIGYKVLAVCALCKHGKFRPGNDFGDCQKFTYKHLKHSADSKPLSISKFGICYEYEGDPEKDAFLHGFKDL